MGTHAIWRRLLWKEYRESGPILLIGLLMPAALLLLRHKEGWLYPGIALTAMLVMLWAVERAHSKGFTRGSLRSVLPLTTVSRWLATFLLPVVLPLLVGALLGVAVIAFRPTNATLPEILPSTVGFMLALFVLCTVLTQVYSPIHALFAGALLLFFTFDPIGLPGNVGFYLLVAGSALGISLLWEPFAARQWYRSGRFTLAVALVAAIFVPVNWGQEIPFLKDYQQRRREAQYEQQVIYYYNLYESPDTAISIGPDKSHGLQYQNLRTGQTRSHDFPPVTGTIEVVNDTQVLLMHQPHGASYIKILTWDTRTDQVREVAVPVGRNAFTRYAFSRCSPDGRYLLLGLNSKINTGQDLWLADLQRGTGRLVVPDAHYYEWTWFGTIQASWPAGHLLLTGTDKNMMIDLRTGHATPFTLPYPGRTVR